MYSGFGVVVVLFSGVLKMYARLPFVEDGASYI